MCVNPPADSILGRFIGSSALNLNFCSNITVSINSSVLARCSPGQALFPEKRKYVNLQCYYFVPFNIIYFSFSIFALHMKHYFLSICSDY